MTHHLRLRCLRNAINFLHYLNASWLTKLLLNHDYRLSILLLNVCLTICKRRQSSLWLLLVLELILLLLIDKISILRLVSLLDTRLHLQLI